MVQYCWNLLGWRLRRTVRELCQQPLPAPARFRPSFLEVPQKASGLQLRQAALHGEALKQTLQSNDELNSHSYKSHQQFPNEEPESALKQMGHKVHEVRTNHSYPWQTFGPRPNPVNIFAAKQLWCFMLCLFPLTPPQWAYIFVFLCLHICTVPKGIHTLSLGLGASH